MKRLQLKVAAPAAAALRAPALCASAAAQGKGAAAFRIPDGWTAADKTEAGPALMLHPEKPAVMFVTHPKPEEATTGAQRRRLTPASGAEQGKTRPL